MSRHNLQIVVLSGVPGSGKSTWAKKFVKDNPDWIRINRDDFRFMMKDLPFCESKIEETITEIAYEAIDISLSKRLNVIIDNTHLRISYITEIASRFNHVADISFKLFDIDLEEAIERDSKRDKKVGREVIEKMYPQYLKLKETFDFNLVYTKQNRAYLMPTKSSQKENAVVFDIDGTLSHMQSRGPFQWDKVDTDVYNWIVGEQIQFHKLKGRKIIILSGREDLCKNLTEKWLKENGIEYDEIHMRKGGDYRKDNIIKREIYENELLPKYNILAAYDDRRQVTEELYKMGIFCFNVNQGNLRF